MDWGVDFILQLEAHPLPDIPGKVLRIVRGYYRPDRQNDQVDNPGRPAPELFRPQRFHRIQMARLPRREQAREQCRQGQHGRRRSQQERTVRGDLIELSRD
jgi:hypothetical protein